MVPILYIWGLIDGIEYRLSTSCLKCDERELGFGRKLATQVLKELLKLHEFNWELIEDENYRAFVDAILDAQEDGINRQVV
ncbi:histone-lysine N-methyltransferase SUVR4-like protein [Carex littledalei]|uniref:Histone-lysine N-methyltransferase SUVR4-like protein n=1 Tax=Carex littledalei TaxID=544730 RepID=A0A833QWD3_9POAL|nr:histone-lysine N-methyltransferase SUVR4-like protein [Carex littledalei]